MNKFILIGVWLIFCIFLIGCIDNETEKEIIEKSIINETQTIQYIEEPIKIFTEKEQFLIFMKNDKTDEIEYHKDDVGSKKYFVCSGFARQFAENASVAGWEVGGITLRDHEHVKYSNSYHAMNYIIIDNEFIIIEPQSDELNSLDSIYFHWNKNFRYITVHPNAQVMINYGSCKQTIDIDIFKEFNETELCERWEV